MSREYDVQREKYPTIEMTDQQFLAKMEGIAFIYSPPVLPPLIPMKLEMPILEAEIAKSKSKNPKKKASKLSRKANRPAVEKV